VVRLALLRESRDAKRSHGLRRAVDGMVAGTPHPSSFRRPRRHLAEAQWRLGDEDAADSAADLGA